MGETKTTKTIIINHGATSHHMLVAYHYGDVFLDNKLQKADIIHKVLREWFTDNTCRYSFLSFKSLKTFRSFVADAKCGYYLREQNPKDKKIVIYNKKGQWWELVIKDQELDLTKSKVKSEDFRDVFKIRYADKHRKYYQFDFSEQDSITKKLKAMKAYLSEGK